MTDVCMTSTVVFGYLPSKALKAANTCQAARLLNTNVLRYQAHALHVRQHVHPGGISHMSDSNSMCVGKLQMALICTAGCKNAWSMSLTSEETATLET